MLTTRCRCTAKFGDREALPALQRRTRSATCSLAYLKAALGLLSTSDRRCCSVRAMAEAFPSRRLEDLPPHGQKL